MKQIKLILALVVLTMLPLGASEDNDLLNLINLVSNVEVKARAKHITRASSFIENMHHAYYRDEFLALQNAMKTDWPVAVSNLDVIAKDDLTKTIVISSSDHIPEEDFAVFLGEIANLVEQGKLDREIYSWCESPPDGPLRGFLLRNYNNPEVQEVIQRSRKIFKDDPTFVSYYDDILSGDALRRYKRLEAEMKGMPPTWVLVFAVVIVFVVIVVVWLFLKRKRPTSLSTPTEKSRCK